MFTRVDWLPTVRGLNGSETKGPLRFSGPFFMRGLLYGCAHRRELAIDGSDLPRSASLPSSPTAFLRHGRPPFTTFELK